MGPRLSWSSLSHSRRKFSLAFRPSSDGTASEFYNLSSPRIISSLKKENGTDVKRSVSLSLQLYADIFCDFWVVLFLSPFLLLYLSTCRHCWIRQKVLALRLPITSCITRSINEKRNDFARNSIQLASRATGTLLKFLKWGHLARRCAHHTMVQNIARPPKLKWMRVERQKIHLLGPTNHRMKTIQRWRPQVKNSTCHRNSASRFLGWLTRQSFWPPALEKSRNQKVKDAAMEKKRRAATC